MASLAIFEEKNKSGIGWSIFFCCLSFEPRCFPSHSCEFSGERWREGLKLHVGPALQKRASCDYQDTPRKINILKLRIQNLEEEKHLPNHHFSGSMLIFRGVNPFAKVKVLLSYNVAIEHRVKERIRYQKIIKKVNKRFFTWHFGSGLHPTDTSCRSWCNKENDQLT